MTVHLPVPVARLRLEGTTLELGGGDGQYLRRLENAPPAVLQHALQCSGLGNVVEDVTLDVPGLQLVSSVFNTLPPARRLQVKVDSESDGSALRRYLAGHRKVSFLGLRELNISAKRVSRFTSQKTLRSFIASLEASQLKRIDGGSC